MCLIIEGGDSIEETEVFLDSPSHSGTVPDTMRRIGGGDRNAGDCGVGGLRRGRRKRDLDAGQRRDIDNQRCGGYGRLRI